MPVHLAAPIDSSGRFGSTHTPDEAIRVACSPDAPLPKRPRRTLRADMITCPACLAWAEAHPEAFADSRYPLSAAPAVRVRRSGATKPSVRASGGDDGGGRAGS